MKTEDKIKRIVARNPELKETILSLSNEKVKASLQTLVEKDIKKAILIGRNIESKVRLFELATIMNTGYPRVLQVTTADLLDYYVGDDSDEPRSLSDVVADLVIIHDSRAFVPNKQKSNMVMQVFEQNERVLYYYKGTLTSYNQEHQLLGSYTKENPDIIIHVDRKQTQGEEV